MISGAPVIATLALAMIVPAAALAAGGAWVAEGPSPIAFAQVENITPDNEAVGAIHTVVAHPTNANVLYAGTVNGGVWKTTNATALRPDWERLTDEESSLSIGALEFDAYDGSRRTLVAGIGLFSSFGRLGGPRTGLLRTRDAGATWQSIDGGGILIDKNISGVASRGSTLVVAVNFAVPFTFGNIGIWRSTNDGASFTQIAVGDGTLTGLPGGVTYDLVGDPLNPNRLFTSVVFADLVSGVNGVYRSDNAGATWTKVSDAAIDALLISGVTSNVEFAVGRHDNVYAAIANSGRLAGLFRSGDGGNTWTPLDVPVTGPLNVGIHPGGQASIHLSIVADPNDPDVVYIGGDRQPFTLEEGLPFPPQFPNTIGAVNFSGRLFRVDAGLAPGSQFAHLTHSNSLGPAGGGTASDSSPHADSREMVFDAAGNIIETDDGGIYKRTSPQSNAGDWFSLNGDIQVNEQHDAIYDTVSDIYFSGNQDNGTGMQNLPADVLWFLWSGGDGGDVAVDETSIPGTSIRYSSAQGLQIFNRSFWDAGNNFLGFTFVGLTVIGGGSPIQGQFSTPIRLNAADPTRLVIGGGNSVYESFDQGDTITEIGPGIVANGNDSQALAYGAAGNPDILYVGSGSELYVRTGAPPAPLVVSATFPGSGSGFAVRDIVIDPDDADTAYVINSIGVFHTPDAGVSWNDVTGNLLSEALTPLRALAYVATAKGDALVVGGLNGVFIAQETSGFTDWAELGTGFPNVPVFDLDYDADDDVVSAGTLGRGSWQQADVTPLAVDDILLGAYHTSPGTIVEITTASGTLTDLLNSGLNGVTAAAQDTGDVLYLATGDGNDSLYESDLGTGTTSLVGAFTGGASNVQAMDVAPAASSALGFDAGALYAISIDGLGGCNPNCFFKIDKSTGAATQIAGLSLNQGRGMSFDPVTGELWVYDQGGRNLYTLSATGSLQFQFNVPSVNVQDRTGVGTVFSLAHSCDGGLYGWDVSHRVLVRIDLAQQQAFWVGDPASGSVDVQGLDGRPAACVP